MKDNEIPSGQGWLQNMPITGDQVKYYGQKALVQGMIEKIAEVRRDIDSFTKSQEEAILKVMKTQSDSAGKTDLQMIEDFKNIQFRIALAPALRPLVLESYVQTNPQLRE